MAEQTDIAVLTYELLKKVHTRIDAIADDVHDLKIRMSAMEVAVGNIQLQIGQINTRLDRFDERLTRIEIRLDLIAAE